VRDRLAIIGWTENIDLPDWGIRGLRAKVDTGALTSALHAEDIEELPRGRVRFDVILDRRKPDRRVHVRAHICRRGRVRSSTGHYTTRIFVTTRLCLGPNEHVIEISLVNRERMLHRMLLGRSALEGRYLVDASRRGVLGKGHPEQRMRERRKRSTRL
jgi:hypothetical protein